MVKRCMDGRVFGNVNGGTLRGSSREPDGFLRVLSMRALKASQGEWKADSGGCSGGGIVSVQQDWLRG